MSMDTPESPLDLLEFPVDYEFKAFGPNEEGFNQALLEAIAAIAPVSEHSLRQRPSSSGNYRCVTLLVRVQNREQLQQVYARIQSVKGLRYLL